MGDFVHLHVHSEYSLLDGFGSPGALHARARALGQRALAITDHGNTHAHVKHLAAQGIRPIVGAEMYVGAEHGHLIVLAKSREGIGALNRLVSLGNCSGFNRRPVISREDLERERNGLMVLSGCIGSEIGKALAEGDEAKALETMHWYRDVFGEDYWLEVQNHGIELEARMREWSTRQSREVRIVATQDSHFVMREDARAHEMLLALQTHSAWDDPKRWRFEGEGYWLASTEEMEAKFPREWTRETLAVAERVAYSPLVLEDTLPWPAGAGPDLAGDLRRKALEGWRLRFPSGAGAERLEYELDVIAKTKYERYFLIVADLCRWARESGIRRSARGSAAGSLVAYCLGITPVDPLHYGLSFERFLNEGRKPDIDLDFEDARRGEVVAYAKKAYGADGVAPIITFAQIGGRMALRDVGRVLGVPVGALCAQVPLGGTLAESPLAKEGVVKDALALEGTVRHAGKHAAGLVIANVRLASVCGLARAQDGGAPLAAVEMQDIEALGLVKFDILGLKTLSVIGDTLRRIGHEPAMQDGDTKAYECLSTGNTTGVFQVESPGMRQVLRELKPSKIEHLQAVVALYRPGPLESIGTYVRRKNGEEAAHYYSEHFEPVLGETYGLLVYQEAIMDIAHKLAGMTPYESDQFLGAVRKKDKTKLARYEPKFRDGLARAGVPQHAVDALWRDILPFANYGFNKAHAACYGALAYETAWLKSHWPAEFFASLMAASEQEGLGELVRDARRNGVRVRPPCVNKSGLGFGHEPGAVRYGLRGIKYVGQGALDAIMEARERGPFESLEDFLARVPKRRCNKRATLNLAYGGAFDGLMHRRVALAALGGAEGTLRQRLEAERGALGMALSQDILESVSWQGRDTMSGDMTAAGQACMGGEVLARRDMLTKTGRPMARLEMRDEQGEFDATLFDAGRHGDVKSGALVMLHGKPECWQGKWSLVVSRVSQV